MATAPRSEGGRRRNPGDNGRKWFFVRVASRVDVITPNHRVPGGPPASPPSRSADSSLLRRRSAAVAPPLLPGSLGGVLLSLALEQGE